MSFSPDGIMLSNGPGDPKECPKAIAELKKVYAHGIPTFAICLGHQLMALAQGFDTYKLKYGHRGINHPVKDLSTNRVYITSQNHGFVHIYMLRKILYLQSCMFLYLYLNDSFSLLLKTKNG